MTTAVKPTEERTKAQDLLDQVKAGVAQVRDSEGWRKWIEFQSKFWQYSFYNTFLIGAQCPHASHVAGFLKWKSMGRHVRKGQHGIAILAPMFRLVPKDKDDADGPKIKALVGFRPVSVFDVSQTSGEPVPEIYKPLQGASPAGIFEKLKAWIEGQNYKVSFRETRDGLFGFLNSSREIVLKTGESGLQTLATLVHECAHAILGHIGDTHKARDVGEIEAETTSWIVGKNLGLDTDASSFAYLATWSQSDPTGEKLMKAGQRAAEAARKILAGLEGSNGKEVRDEPSGT